MTKLFISYSRDDKAWVYELWRALRDRAHYDAWIDQRIVPAQDWWDSILTNIEDADCVIYVMTPRSVESIYCVAEINYALELNKPVLPLMLKTCETPADVKRRRIQYQVVGDDMSLGDVLFTIERGLGDVRVGLLQGKYPPPNPLPTRPDEPKPARKPEQVSEVFMLAEEAAVENNFSLAEKLFQQVIDADPKGYGLAAAERLGEIRDERVRNADYLNIVQMAANPALRKGALALWRVFVNKHGTDYDPNGLAALLTESASAPVKRSRRETSASPTPVPPLPTRKHSLDLLPAPFSWIDIPGTLGKKWNDAPFKIAKYPVTNAQFRLFVDAGGYRERKWWTEAGWEAREEGWHYDGGWKPSGKPWLEPRYWNDSQWNGAEQPVVGVSWYEAVAFCLWLSDVTGENVMLPSAAQWQYAAQGDDGRDFPWGKEWDCKKCNNSVSPCKSNVTTPVRQYEGKGDSFFGVVDLAGNVWEWCSTDYEGGSDDINIVAKYRVLRGGSWLNDLTDFFRCDGRNWFNPLDGDCLNGFRLALS